jgi:hypothetical protein
MSAGPVQTNIVFVPVAGVDWNRFSKPSPPRHHKSSREAWDKKRQAIPADRASNREMVRRLLERTRAQRTEMIERGKAMLAMLRAA